VSSDESAVASDRAIPISEVSVDDPATQALVLEVLRSGHLAQGPMVARLEEGFARLVGVDHAIAVTSGTTALVLAVDACGIEPGDEVVTSAFTFAATLNAILEAGAVARFADVSLEDFCVDPASVEAAVTERTRALLPVHLYGQCADMDALTAIADRTGAAMIEDAAQSHGARFAGRAAGSFGVGCFSLYATKNMTTGEGGIVTTADAGLAERMRILRNQGMRARYEYVVPGHNYRLTDLQAAVGIPQLEALEASTARRRENAARITAGLDDVPGVALPRELPKRDHVWHQYTVRVLEGGQR
jgi:perosamine synthetase